jgi:hypothetical protein
MAEYEIDRNIELNFLKQRKTKLEKAVLQIRVDLKSLKSRLDEITALETRATAELKEISAKIVSLEAAKEEEAIRDGAAGPK